MEIKIDKTNWKQVRLGDVANEYSKRIKNPSESEFDRFIGSSNIGQWDFRIKSWEATTSVSSAMKLFKPNDYLLVRRSLYASDFRERAPRADFYGVCSGDILTIRENPKFIHDGFLIGVLNSPSLWKYVVANASGSITRRIKWRDLANYEFLLPPKDQQEQLAELLWAGDAVVERELKVLNKLKNIYQAIVDDLFSKNQKSWNYIKLNSIASINQKSLKSNTDANFEFNYLDIAGIIEPKVIGKLEKIKFSNAPSRARRIVNNDNIVLSLVRPYHKSFVFVSDAKDIIASTGTGVIEVDKKHNKKFIFHQFFSRRFLQYCENMMTGTNYPAISSADLQNFKMGIPKEKIVEDTIAMKLDSIDISIEETKSKITTTQTLQKSLINQIF